MMYRTEDGKFRGPETLSEFQTEYDDKKLWLKRLNESKPSFGIMTSGLKNELLEVGLISGGLTFLIAVGAARIFGARVEFFGPDTSKWLLTYGLIFSMKLYYVAFHNSKKHQDAKSEVIGDIRQLSLIIRLLQETKELEK